MHDGKTALFHNSKLWLKQSGQEGISVPMGCSGIAKVCELIGSFMLINFASVVHKENIGLYGDDSFSIFHHTSKAEKRGKL